MPKDWAGALGLWRALFFSCLISHGGAPAAPVLHCHTDYAKEVVCYWDVTNTTDCARGFRLDVWNSYGHQKECAFENRTTPELASPRCVCVIFETSFGGTEYTFSLVATGTKTSRTEKVLLRDIVQPRPLRNLRVTKSEERRSFTLAWEQSYNETWNLKGSDVFYQIEVSAEGQKQPDTINLTEQMEHYEIFTDRLSPGKDYTAKTRYQIMHGSLWSEWSPSVRWHNDVEPKSGDQLWWFVLLACLLVLVLVSACYCCFARLKRQWWDQIPRPKIAGDLGKKQSLVPWSMLPGDEGKVPLCAASQDRLGRQLSFVDSPPKDRAALPGQPDEVAEFVPKGKWVAVLTPEAPPVEPSLTVCGPKAAPEPGTQVEEEEEEDCLPRHDAAVAELFLDLLGAGDSTGDAETPQPVREKPPPAGPPARGGLCLLGGTPGKSARGSSEAGRRSGDVATSSRAASPAPEPHQGDGPPASSSQRKVVLFAQQLPSAPYRVLVTDRMDSKGDGAPQPSGYKSFSRLGGQAPASGPQPCEHPPDFPQVDQAQPLSREGGLLSPPQQEAAPWDPPNAPCMVAGSGSPGYRPFRPASQDGSGLRSGSPYKPLLLEVFRSDPKGGPPEVAGAPHLRTWEAEGGARQGGPWEEPLAFAFRWCSEEEEAESGPGGARQGTECVLHQVPLAPL